MTPWRTFLQTLARNPISLFAVVCVAATAAFLGYMAYRLITVLESPQWCGRAIQAERISAENFTGLEGCVELLRIQLEAIANGLLIAMGSFAFSLIVLVVVVVAGAKASGKLPGGVEFDVSRDAVSAAHQVASAAEEEAEAITEGRHA